MKEYERMAERAKRRFPEGARVELVFTSDPYTRLKPGDTGEVSFVDDMGTIHVNWDNGSTLGMVLGEDELRIL